VFLDCGHNSPLKSYNGCVMTEHSLGDCLDAFAVRHTVLMGFVVK
jgi:hypothetical protein